MEIPTGTWQPSYAFLGKMAWNKNYLIIKSDVVVIHALGGEREAFDYKEIKEVSMPTILLSNSRVWKFEINPKFACKPKSKFSYDKECTQHEQRKVFRLLQCESVESQSKSCSILDTYFSFDKKELAKLKWIE
ncbi:hypothetical protein [Psychromonas aquimarina]|uniref:hypothetical protein n=1 Tax=Psychromonas aquimarina TaxID=444919 RepID=UPI0012F7E148|nr:hypothetical protein [Psychromonas aquimarina]